MPQAPFGFRIFANLLGTYKIYRYGSDDMEGLLGKAMKDTVALHKPSPPWKDDEPHPQSYHTFDAATSSWTSRTPSPGDAADPTKAGNDGINTIALYSWNIDFMIPCAEARMRPALAHLDSIVAPNPPNTASVIFIQECTPGDLATIAATPWVRDRFHMTDLDHSNWSTSHYGTVTLIDLRLPITSVFRVHYSKTQMDRDASFVDVSLGGKTVRLCNTHLESLRFDPPFRPPQMQIVAKFLHDDKVHAGLAAGDFNAIEPFDRTLHSDNDLKDAFLELGGKEDTPEAYTWGQQAKTTLRERYGCTRMDKVFFTGGVDVVKFERFGEDVLAEGEEARDRFERLEFEKPWVTDHLGVMAEVKLAEKSASRL